MHRVKNKSERSKPAPNPTPLANSDAPDFIRRKSSKKKEKDDLDDGRRKRFDIEDNSAGQLRDLDPNEPI